MFNILKPALLGDFGNGTVLVAQKFLGVTYSDLQKILNRRHTAQGSEYSAKIGVTHHAQFYKS